MTLSRLTLSSGRVVDLVELRMSATYSGLLEGHPGRRLNDDLVAALMRTAATMVPGDPPHLLAPLLDFPDAPSGASGRWEVLPAVSCIGSFRSAPVGVEPDSGFGFSSLVVVWFQAAATVPSDASAERGLLDLRWSELAHDHEM